MRKKGNGENTLTRSFASLALSPPSKLHSLPNMEVNGIGSGARAWQQGGPRRRSPYKETRDTNFTKADFTREINARIDNEAI